VQLGLSLPFNNLNVHQDTAAMILDNSQLDDGIDGCKHFRYCREVVVTSQ